METKIIEFKIPISVDDFNSEHVYLHNVLDKISDVDFNFEYNWLTMVDKYDHKSETYIKYQENKKLDEGFNDYDYDLDISYKDGYVCGYLIVNNPNELRTVSHHYSTFTSVTTRKLIDWIKLTINNQLSDGIGENENGYVYFNDMTRSEVWMYPHEMITDEETDQQWGFKIEEPIEYKEIKDKNIKLLSHIKSFLYFYSVKIKTKTL